MSLVSRSSSAGFARAIRSPPQSYNPALMNETSWLETYRGMVYRWEVDPVDHFTVAFYFARFEDATLALLHAVGLDPDALAHAGQAAVPAEGNVRYPRELRLG